MLIKGLFIQNEPDGLICVEVHYLCYDVDVVILLKCCYC